MSSTRHHINHQRRRQARADRPRTATESGPTAGTVTQDPPRPANEGARRFIRVPLISPPTVGTAPRRDTGPDADDAPDKPAGAMNRPRRTPYVVGALCVLTLLLGGFAGWAHSRAETLREQPERRNTALTDSAATSEIKGQTSRAVAALFSYDHADPAAFDEAARKLLTGRAVAQHRDLFAKVRDRAAEQKAVITTTVTDSGVERIDGDRARVLVYADQSSVSTAAKSAKTDDQGTYAGAVLAVDVVRRDGRWLISGIDTFGR
jgi:Mce-associated membrane protein